MMDGCIQKKPVTMTEMYAFALLPVHNLFSSLHACDRVLITVHDYRSVP